MKPRRKGQPFGFTYVFFGLVLGFFLGSGIVYWYTSRDEGANLFAHAWNYLGSLFEPSANEKQAVTITTLEDELDKNAPRQRRTRQAGVKQSDTEFSPDTLATTQEIIHPDSLPAVDALPLPSEDGSHTSTINDSGTDIRQDAVRDRSQLRVAQERLLQIRAFSRDPGNYSPKQSDAIRQLDSLLGGATQSRLTDDIIIVEFWISPLNARGYIMQNNKLLVYGLREIHNFGLETDGSRLYIRYSDAYYAITHTNDFSPFVPSIPAETIVLQQRWP